MRVDTESWENDGGATPDKAGISAVALSGTAAQIEWAERIRIRVHAEFNRVLATFRSVAERQAGSKRAATIAIMAIVEEKRDEVLSRHQAGYFIHDWQEISDQVRRMILNDGRYQELDKNRSAQHG